MRDLRFWTMGPLATAALSLSACAPSSHDNAAPANQVSNAEATDFANRMAGAEQPVPAGKPFAVSEKTDLLDFVYDYPGQAAAVPALVSKLGKAMAEAKENALKMARADQKSAKESGYPFRKHSLETRWTVTADTPRLLALKSETYIFTGGAHGMTGYDSLLWDRHTKRETSLAAMMTSPKAFAAAIHDGFCKELDRQRAEKRGAPVVRGDDDFTQCIDPMKEVLMLTSKDGKLIDGVTVIVGPYSAGPYAEGSYDVVLPVDGAIRDAIKTEYQDAFIAAR
ncbi:MAG: DUF4163 domain-containing protein [Sphingobium sp.]